MEAILLTLYVLVWPVIVAGVLFIIARSFIKELLQARREGRTIV